MAEGEQVPIDALRWSCGIDSLCNGDICVDVCKISKYKRFSA
jgi:hypothetical protein